MRNLINSTRLMKPVGCVFAGFFATEDDGTAD